MEIRTFCMGSDMIARKKHFYLKYNLLLYICLASPILIFVLDELKVIQIKTIVVVIFVIIWAILFIIAMTGRGGIAELRFQMYAVTTDDKLVHFWFKEILREGKVVLKYTPIKKLTRNKEVVEIVKRKEEIIKDSNLEDYLYTLCNKKEVQKKSDILFEVMENVKIIKENKIYINLVYTIGTHNTVKKVRIYKNLKSMEAVLQIIYQQNVL